MVIRDFKTRRRGIPVYVHKFGFGGFPFWLFLIHGLLFDSGAKDRGRLGVERRPEIIKSPGLVSKSDEGLGLDSWRQPACLSARRASSKLSSDFSV